MTNNEKPFDEQDSLNLITDMIRKAKGTFHERGTSAILWGAVVAFCGITSFICLEYDLWPGFDIWLLILVAVIPQVWISIQEGKRRQIKTYQQSATDMVWIVYMISIISLVVYQNIVPGATQRILTEEGQTLMLRTNDSGLVEGIKPFLPSITSIYLIIYAFPTLATGLINRFKPMIWGAAVCYLFFIASLFTSAKYDMLLAGLAAIGNWLIPGIILRRRFLKGRKANV